MLFRNSLRFKGYWLSLLCWLMLSFAVPMTNALAQTDSGFMRICSAHGALWVENLTEQQPSFQSSTLEQCPCLGQLLQVDLAQLHGDSTLVDSKISGAPQTPYVAVNNYSLIPRAPPTK